MKKKLNIIVFAPHATLEYERVAINFLGSEHFNVMLTTRIDSFISKLERVIPDLIIIDTHNHSGNLLEATIKYVFGMLDVNNYTSTKVVLYKKELLQKPFGLLSINKFEEVVKLFNIKNMIAA